MQKKSIFPFSSSEVARVTSLSALACLKHVGRGDRLLADQVAVQAMRGAFRAWDFKGEVVIGEGERDSAPMLYIGERVGRGSHSEPAWDIAVDPLEGTNLCAKALGGALSVLALAPRGGLLKAPDIYMEKIACGPQAKEVIDLQFTPAENIKNTAQALGKKVSEVMVSILDRSRHKELIQAVYDVGARVQLIEDGDLTASILTCWPEGVDLMMGTGGAPEGVLSATALKCLGGGFQARLVFQNEEQKRRAKKMGIDNLDKIYQLKELASGPVVFCASGVTDGLLLKGPKKEGEGFKIESLYMNSDTKECLTLKSVESLSSLESLEVSE